jgi:hypothetical protein
LSLVDKSMVTPVEDSDRYRMLETLRQYGQARLADTGELAALRDRHLEWAATLLDPRDYPFVERMRAHTPVVDDLRGALDWALLRGDGDRCHRLGYMVGSWERSFGNAAAASSAFTQALAMKGGDPGLVVLLRVGLAMCEWEMGSRDPAADAALVQTARALGDDPLLAECLIGAGLRTVSRPRQAIGLLTEVADLAGRAGATAMLGQCRSLLAMAHAYNGDWAEAERLADLVPGDPEVSLQAGNRQAARCQACFSTGRFDRAREVAEEHAGSLPSRRMGNPRARALSLLVVVRIDLAQGRQTCSALDSLRAALEEGRSRGFARALATGWAAGAWALAHGDVDGAVESLSAWRDQTADQPPLNVEGAVMTLARALLAAGRVDQARSLLDGMNEPLELLSAQAIAQLHHLDATIKRAEGDLAGAQTLLHQILPTQHRRGWRPDLVHTLEALAGMAAAHGSSVDCARLAGAAQALRDQMGYRLRWADEQAYYDADLAAARDALGDNRFGQAWAEGLEMDDEAAVAYASRAKGEGARTVLE